MEKVRSCFSECSYEVIESDIIKTYDIEAVCLDLTVLIHEIVEGRIKISANEMSVLQEYYAVFSTTDLNTVFADLEMNIQKFIMLLLKKNWFLLDISEDFICFLLCYSY